MLRNQESEPDTDYLAFRVMFNLPASKNCNIQTI